MNIEDLANIHIGEVINKWIRIHNITQAKFAQLLGMPTTNATRLLKKKTIDTHLLQIVGMQLKHNFFRIFVSGQEYDVEDSPLVIVHIGESINHRLRELKMTQADFAAGLGIYQPEVSKILKKGSIDTGKLAAISQLLDYNFFEEFIPKVEKETCTSSKDVLQRLEELIVENERLKQEISRLKEENCLLKEECIKFKHNS